MNTVLSDLSVILTHYINRPSRYVCMYACTEIRLHRTLWVPATWVDLYGAERDGRGTQKNDARCCVWIAMKVVLHDDVHPMTLVGLLEPVQTSCHPVTRDAPAQSLHLRQCLLHRDVPRKRYHHHQHHQHHHYHPQRSVLTVLAKYVCMSVCLHVSCM